jgi:hypothetical protein
MRYTCHIYTPGTRYTQHALHTQWLRPWYTYQLVYACYVMQVNLKCITQCAFQIHLHYMDEYMYYI